VQIFPDKKYEAIAKDQGHMAIKEQVDLVRRGPEVWNEWKRNHPASQVDLSGADFSNAYLSGADLTGVNLSGANLVNAFLERADLSNATLHEADLSEANLAWTQLSYASLSRAILRRAHFYNSALRAADLTSADLQDANLRWTNLRWANFTSANLRRARLGGAIMVETVLDRADMTGCFVHGLSAWDVSLDGTIQKDLVITDEDQTVVTVDDLEIAQFMYILLNNKKIRGVIDAITSKVVLILGRFSPERKPILDALRNELRTRNYTPILFDFEKPSSRDLTETISTLAHIARFVVADITDARSIPQELMAIVPSLPSVPVQPILLASQHEYGMFEHFRRYPWVLPVYLYRDEKHLVGSLESKVIGPADARAKEEAGL
jgi:uncharacterized protein YjbI with pentapeptide repeats